MSDITEEDVMKYCYSRNLMLVTKESLEYMHRPIVIETVNKDAIPIKWIKNYARHKASKGFTEIDCYWQFWEDDVLKMVADWEKENEQTNRRR